MNYHRALKQWNTLGGQQRKRVGLDEAWAMPRRGSEAYHEVQALRDRGREEKQPQDVFAPRAPAPAPLRMRRPRMAPPVRAPEAEGWDKQWLLPERIRSLRAEGKPIPLRMKYRLLKESIDRVIGISNKGTDENALRTLLSTHLTKAQYEHFQAMNDEYDALTRRRTKAGSPADVRNKARMAELAPQIEGIRNGIRDLLLQYKEQHDALKAISDEIERTIRSDGSSASNAHLMRLAEEAVGITERFNQGGEHRVYGVRRDVVQRIL